MIAVRTRKVERIILWCPHIFKETRSVATVKQFRKRTCDDAIRLQFKGCVVLFFKVNSYV